MQEFDERPPDTRLHDTGLVPLDPMERNEIDPVPPAAAPWKKEPLFNKKVMAAWAVGAFFVWFAVTQVVPIVFATVKTTVQETVRELENDGTITITRSRDGKIIRIERTPPATATPLPPVPSRTAAPAGTAVPAPAPEVVKTPDAKK